MDSSLADQLIESTSADLDSPSECGRAQRFFCDCLLGVRARLPRLAQELLARDLALLSEEEFAASRVELWRLIGNDSMGSTPEGALMRAAIIALGGTQRDGPLDAIAMFCGFCLRAGISKETLVHAFQRQWGPHAG
jgi:hypothetical protein